MRKKGVASGQVQNETEPREQVLAAGPESPPEPKLAAGAEPAAGEAELVAGEPVLARKQTKRRLRKNAAGNTTGPEPPPESEPAAGAEPVAGEAELVAGEAVLATGQEPTVCSTVAEPD